MSKKGQFYIIGIIFIAFAFLLLFLYLNTGKEMSKVMFESTSDEMLYNALYATREHNEWVALKENSSEPWWDMAWNFRIKFNYSMPLNNANYTILLDAKIPREHVANCTNELRLVNASSYDFKAEIPSVVNASHPPCAIVFWQPLVSGQIYTFWIYYNNSAATLPSYRTFSQNTGNGSNNQLYPEEEASICMHLNSLPYGTNYFNCSLPSFLNLKGTQFGSGAYNETANYSITFESPNLRYKGAVKIG